MKVVEVIKLKIKKKKQLKIVKKQNQKTSLIKRNVKATHAI